MPDFVPQSLAAWTGGAWRGSEPTRVIGFCQDTRKLVPGQCFVALTTGQRDGHDFLEQAESAGASCALVNRHVEGSSLPQLVVDDVLKAFQTIAAEHRRAFPGKVIGVTGSCGKTTTKDLLAALLGPRTLKTEGNLNNFIGVPLTLTRIDYTAHDYAVVEAGINEPGEMDMLARMIEADAAVCTMVGPAHLEKLGSVEGVAREKSRLGALAREGSPVLFPADCWRYGEFAAFGPRAWVATPPGTSQQQEVSSRINYRTETIDKSGCRLHIEPAALLPGTYTVPFTSEGLISNAALAITAAQLCGAEPTVLQERLMHWRPGSHRGQWRRLGNCDVYDDAYNANPASLAESLQAFVNTAPNDQPRLFVLGGMKELGDNSAALHEAAGAKLPWQEGDRVILIGDEANGYAAGLPRAGVPTSSVELFANVEAAKGALEGFQGSIFLKGSRAYALERLLDYVPQSEGAAC